MSVQEYEKLIELDQTLITENETHDKEEAEKQLTTNEEIAPTEILPITQSEEDDFVKIENNSPSNKENSDSEEEEELSEEELFSSSEESDSSEEKSSEACKTWIPLLVATFLAFGVLFSLITFYPLTTNSESEWINYANKCCGTHYGQMRCLLDLTCRSKLNRWIDLQPRLSNETNHLSRCCYLYAPYDQSYFFSQYYCDPHCLKPRLI